MCLIRCAVRLISLLGAEGSVGRWMGIWETWIQIWPLQSDLLHVLEKVTVLCCSLLPLFPSLHLACSAWKLEKDLLRFKRQGEK